MEKIIPLDEFPDVLSLFGSYNRNIKLMCDIFNVKIIARDNLKIYGEKTNVEKIPLIVSAIKEQILKKGKISPTQVENIIKKFSDSVEKEQKINVGNFPVSPRTVGQGNYMQAVRNFEIVFAIGPAGTGKTYLAVAMALEALIQGTVRKLVLVRPAVEAGEKLGFLPGDYQAKINPYLRPLYDSLYNLVEYDKLQRYIDKDIIEVVPLAYMRGRTLESSFIILDEAQNTTQPQMKMFLTRLGVHSRAVITGDITQIDLDDKGMSGLLHAQSVLHDVKGICFHQLTKRDIVRHHLVQRIVAAYEKNDQKLSSGSS